jgi:thiamine kinase-like enzyme
VLEDIHEPNISPWWTTPEWFTAVFREHAIITSGAVVDAQTDIIGQDRGFTGVIVRARLQYAGCEEQEKDETAVRRPFERSAREVTFYRQIAPLIPLRVPHLYYGAVDETTGRVILVLEDFPTTRDGDGLHGCSRTDAALVIDQLARFHAQWWNHSQLDAFSWLPLWGGDSHVAQSRYVQFIGPFLQRFGSRVPKRVREVIDALATGYGDVRERLKRSPVTLIHGDLHLDNLLFAPPQHEPGVTVLDWQSVARGRGVIDLAIFLFESLDTTTRRAVEGDLLRQYHGLLLAGGVTGYDFSQLIEDCRLVLLWLLGANVVWRGSLGIDDLSGREQVLVDSLTEDSFAAMLVYHAGSLLPL